MLDPKHPFSELLRRDKRYKFEAYLFVFDALRYGQERMGLGQAAHEEDDLTEKELEVEIEFFDQSTEESLLEEDERHVTGQQLCQAIQRFAIEQYGLLARSVFKHWGIQSTGDFGEIVFNLIDIGQMRKTEHDRREDFDDVYDFEKAFSRQIVFSDDFCPIEDGHSSSND